MSVAIRRPEPRDGEALAAVHERAWLISYAGLIDPSPIVDEPLERRIARWRRLASGDGLPMWVADRGGRAIGFVAYGPSRDPDAPEGTGEVAALYVDPGDQRRGAGAALLARAVEGLRDAGMTRATLWTLEGNAPGRAFYEQHGWRADGSRRDEARAPHLRYAREL